MKGILHTVVGHRFDISTEMAVIVGSLAKLFVGELMDHSTEELKSELRLLRREKLATNSAALGEANPNSDRHPNAYPDADLDPESDPNASTNC